MIKKFDRFGVEDQNIMIDYRTLTQMSQVLRCGTYKLQDLNMVERINLTNGCCVYVCSGADKRYNPFNVHIVRQLDGKKIFKVKSDNGEEYNRDYAVLIFDLDNLNSILEGEKSVLTIQDGPFAGEDMEAYKKVVPLIDEDILWLAKENAYSEASLMVDLINGMYLSHGEEDWRTRLLDNDFNDDNVVVVMKGTLQDDDDDEEDYDSTDDEGGFDETNGFDPSGFYTM